MTDEELLEEVKYVIHEAWRMSQPPRGASVSYTSAVHVDPNARRNELLAAIDRAIALRRMVAALSGSKGGGAGLVEGFGDPHVHVFANTGNGDARCGCGARWTPPR